jgi:hypothetical protein
MWLIVAFAALGLLIGNLVGLTAQSVVSSLLGLLFAFVGGSVLVFLEKLTPEIRKLAGQSILALSVSCLIGTYVGIVVSEWQLLSPKRTVKPATARPTTEGEQAGAITDEMVAREVSGLKQIATNVTARVENLGGRPVLFLRASYVDRIPTTRLSAFAPGRRYNLWMVFDVRSTDFDSMLAEWRNIVRNTTFE